MKIKTTRLLMPEKQNLVLLLKHLYQDYTMVRDTYGANILPALQISTVSWLYDFGYWHNYTEKHHVISRLEFALAYGVPKSYRDFPADTFRFVHGVEDSIEIPVSRKRTKASKVGAINTPYTKNLGELKATFDKLDSESRYQLLIFISRLCEDRYRAGLKQGHSQKGSSILSIRQDRFIDILSEVDLDSSPEALEHTEEDHTFCLTSEQRLRLEYGDMLYALGVRDLLTRP